MPGRLVTLATFDTVAQAYIAKGELEAVGIRAFVTDEETVGMLWHAAAALGGVKVQVAEEDAERADALLAEYFGSADDGPGDGPTAEEQALALPREGGVAHDDGPAEPAEPTAPAAAGGPPPGYREECARRLFFVAWLGLAFPPLIFYAFYLMLNAVLGAGDLSPRGRLNALVGSGVTLVGLAGALLIVSLFRFA